MMHLFSFSPFFASAGQELHFLGMTLGSGGQFVLKLINFAVFFAALYFMLKGSLKAAFKARREELEALLNQAERDKAEGEAQIQKLSQRMQALETELQEAQVKAEQDAEAEKQRILDAARLEAEQILEQTRQDVASHYRLAEKALKEKVADLAIEGAKLRIQAQFKEKGESLTRSLVDQSIRQIGGVQ